MTELFFEVPDGIFTHAQVEALLEASRHSRQGLIKRALARGEILQIKRGLYSLAPRYLRHPLNSFVLAQHVYGPSYVSFESALAHHGWIPEAVYTCTCASLGNARTFETPLGVFSFQRVPQLTFFQEVSTQVDAWGGRFFLAHPAKALCDLLYTRRLSWKGPAQAAEFLRIEEEDWRTVDTETLDRLLASYSSKRVKLFLHGWRKELTG